MNNRKRLLFLLFVAALLSLGSRCSPLALHATRASTSIWRRERKVNVFLRVETDNKRGDVDDLLSNAEAP